MADETTETTQEPAVTAATTEPGQTTPEPGQEPKHPLAEGGVRFNEVYGEMKAAKAQAEMLQREMLDLRRQVSESQKPAAQTPQYYTPAQLQGFVDAGRITPAAMADQIAWQRKEEGKVESRREFEQATQVQRAQDDVDGYLTWKTDALADPRVLQAARDLQRETGWAHTDPRLARRALREVYGPLERVRSADSQRETARQAASTSVNEGRSGGGTATQSQAAADPLAKAPQHLKDFWEAAGTPQAQRVKELAVWQSKTQSAGSKMRLANRGYV